MPGITKNTVEIVGMPSMYFTHHWYSSALKIHNVISHDDFLKFQVFEITLL